MTEQSQAPILIKPIPPQTVNEGGVLHPVNLNDFIQSPTVESGIVKFSAELVDGRPLPKGLICTGNGLLSGIPAKGTEGHYQFLIIADNDSGIPLVVEVPFTVRPRISVDSDQLMSQLKSQVWDAIGHNQTPPDIESLLNRPITEAEIYYLLERFATLTIWDVYNLDFPSERKIIELAEASPHYVVYDRGSCLIMTPKELFSHERTLEDAFQTARALAREVYNRDWTIEFSGLDKLIRAAWVELQVLGDKFGKKLEVLHYSPSVSDVKIYVEKTRGLQL